MGQAESVPTKQEQTVTITAPPVTDAAPFENNKTYYYTDSPKAGDKSATVTKSTAGTTVEASSTAASTPAPADTQSPSPASNTPTTPAPAPTAPASVPAPAPAPASAPAPAPATNAAAAPAAAPSDPAPASTPTTSTSTGATSTESPAPSADIKKEKQSKSVSEFQVVISEEQVRSDPLWLELVQFASPSLKEQVVLKWEPVEVCRIVTSLSEDSLAVELKRRRDKYLKRKRKAAARAKAGLEPKQEKAKPDAFEIPWNLAQGMLVRDQRLAQLRTKLVPAARISEDMFWRCYFERVVEGIKKHTDPLNATA